VGTVRSGKCAEWEDGPHAPLDEVPKICRRTGNNVMCYGDRINCELLENFSEKGGDDESKEMVNSDER